MTTKLFLTNFTTAAIPSPADCKVVFAGGFLAVFLGGCAVQEAPNIPVAAPTISVPAPTVLTEEADAALKAAEQSVTEARVKRALWTAAVEELERARKAAKRFDSLATLQHAREVVALCGLSITQLSAPPVTW